MIQMTPGAVLDALKLAVAVHFGFAHLPEDKRPQVRTYLRSKAAGQLVRAAMVYALRELQDTPGGASIAGAVKSAQRVSGTDVVARLDGVGRVAPRILVLFQSHEGVLQAVAGEDEPGFRRLAQVVKSRDPHAVLRGLARIPGASPSLSWVSAAVRRISTLVTNEKLTPEESAAISADEGRRAAGGILEAKLAQNATDPMTPRGAEAAEQAVAAQQAASDVSSEHAADPAAARAQVAAAQLGTQLHATRTGEQLGLSPEQEHAMTAQGQVLIAAGAGSGKTRVLAGKVVHTIKEKKAPARSVIATSFTRKSAKELKQRIEAYGGHGVLDGAEGYVGTTHSVSLALQRDYGPRGARTDIAKDSLQMGTVRMAIEQVKMHPNSGVPEVPAPRPILDELTPPVQQRGVGGSARINLWKEPANQWFNLGLEEIADQNGRPIGPKQAATEISKYKGHLLSPSQAWKESGNAPTAAIYAAYEWLKRNDIPWSGKQDFDDVLVEGVRLLARNKGARDAVQHRFRHVLVDEAQDQNPAQNTLFGLVAGTHDPQTLKAHPDGRMTAHTYAKIGDDKQAIYSFRGADPDEFIKSSDLVETGGKRGTFKTFMLSTNYRSGANIVNAAQRLIDHNERQVPMTCVADPARRGHGSIYRVDVPTHEAGAAHVADEIESLVKRESAPASYSDFGVATRTNAEAHAYVLEMMKRGIPFRSRVNPLSDRTTQALVRWMHLVSPALGGEEQNDAVLRAHEVPGFSLDAEFGRRIQELSRLHHEPRYLAVLQQFWNQVYEKNQQWRNDKNVRSYLDAIQNLRERHGGSRPGDVLRAVLEMRGAGKNPRSLIDALVDDIREDPDAMAALEVEVGGPPTEDDIRGVALAPVQPVLGLMGSHEDVQSALGYVAKLQRASQKIDRSGEESDHEPAVNVDTAHGWKGLEVNHLFVPMPKGVFPHAYAEQDRAAMEDERRLGYVALTRGRHTVTVLAPRVSHTGKPAGPSQFVDEACIAPLSVPEPEAA